VLAQRDLLRGALFAGNVLEEFLDQVDVCEDHTAAAVSREADSVEGVAGRDDGLVGVIWRVEVVSRVIEGGGGKEIHVFLPEVADDLRGSQYASRTRARWCSSTLPQEKQRIGTIIFANVTRTCTGDRGDQVSRKLRATR
jgi:hypothetical protein